MNRQDLAERLKLWFIQMKAGVYTRRGQGLPPAGPTPLVHIEVVTGILTFTQDYLDYITSGGIHTSHLRRHPEMNKHLGSQYVASGLGPLKNLKKYK